MQYMIRAKIASELAQPLYTSSPEPEIQAFSSCTVAASAWQPRKDETSNSLHRKPSYKLQVVLQIGGFITLKSLGQQQRALAGGGIYQIRVNAVPRGPGLKVAHRSRKMWQKIRHACIDFGP